MLKKEQSMQNEKEMTLVSVLKQMVTIYGETIISNQRKCISVFKDIAPQLKKEQKVLKAALDSGIAVYFVSCPVNEREGNINKALYAIDYLNDDAKELIISSFVEALDWDKELVAKCFSRKSVENQANDGIQEESEEKQESQISVGTAVVTKGNAPVVTPGNKNVAPAKTTYAKNASGTNIVLKSVKSISTNAQTFFRKIKNNLLFAGNLPSKLKAFIAGMFANKKRKIIAASATVLTFFVIAGLFFQSGFSELLPEQALLLLGNMYEEGRVVPRDYQKAVELYQKAAALGNATACNNLGYMYHNGYWVPQDYQKAAEWYQKAAALGNATACDNLGDMYYNGYWGIQSYQKAAEWYHKAAALGNATACDKIGDMYYYGNGIPQDCQKAVEWYHKAAALGNATAYNNLGYMYFYGTGVTRDYQKAVELYQKAADLSNVSAYCNLGFMYENGIGVAQDYQKAMELYEKAANRGIESAIIGLDRIKHRIKQ